jgi:predicted MFS family arabinose efflux permease
LPNPRRGQNSEHGITSAAPAVLARTRRVVERRLGGRRRARVVLVLAAVLGLSSADITTVGASAVQLRQGLHIGDVEIGLLVATTSVVSGIASLPFGALADHVTRTRVLGAAIALWGCAMFASSAAASFDQLLAARIFLGAVTAAAGPFVASLIGDEFADADRGRIYGYILAGELVGAGVGFAVSGNIASISWRAPFAALGVPALALAVLVARLPEPQRRGAGRRRDPAGGAEPSAGSEAPGGPRPPEGHGPGAYVAAARYILSVRTNVLLIAASASGYYFMAGAETFGVEFVRRRYDLSQAAANPLLLVIGIGAVAGVLAGGWLADALGRQGVVTARILVSAAAAVLAAVAFLPAVLTDQATIAAPLLFVAGFGLAAQNPPLDAARLDIMPASLWGRAESVRTLIRTFAQGLAPLIFGALSGAAGLQVTFVVMLIPLVASAWILYRARTSYAEDTTAARVLTA